MSYQTKKIVVADTQFLITESLQTILTKEYKDSDIEVVTSKYELLKSLEKEGNCLVVTDPLLFDFNGLDDLKPIIQRFQQVSLLILTSSVGKAEFNELARIGIKNIVYKTADKEELLAAFDATLRGKKYYSEEVLDLILELNENKAPAQEPTHLTPSEIEIVRLISGGMTTKEIANQKNISFHTVNTHRKNIFRKMGVTNTSELIMQAIKAGWIDNIEYFI